MNRIRIRNAVSKDVQALYALFSAVDQLHREAHPEIFKQAEFPEEIKEYYRSCIADPETIIIIAEDNHQIIGGLICNLETTHNIPIFVPRKYACIENITVSSSYRHQGVGKRLIQAAQKWASKRGANMIELTVWEFNQDAANFYQELGFKTYRRRMVKNINEESR